MTRRSTLSCHCLVSTEEVIRCVLAHTGYIAANVAPRTLPYLSCFSQRLDELKDCQKLTRTPSIAASSDHELQRYEACQWPCSQWLYGSDIRHHERRRGSQAGATEPKSFEYQIPSRSPQSVTIHFPQRTALVRRLCQNSLHGESTCRYLTSFRES